MRAAFVRTVTKLLDENPKVVLLLGDISVHAFKEARDRHPLRVLNVGINEAAMIGMGAGLAKAGFYPIMHSIDPFAIGRAYEQIKLDFGYQKLPGCIVTVGASYDYSTLGCSHHGCESVALMLTVPGMEIYMPCHGAYVRAVMEATVQAERLAYIRLSEAETMPTVSTSIHLSASPIFQNVAVVPIGPTWHLLPPDASAIYVDRLDDMHQWRAFEKILVIEPFYVGTLAHVMAEAFPGARIKSIGVPRKFLTDYGTRAEFDEACGFTKENVARQLEILIRG